jgi:hypothetical protein
MLTAKISFDDAGMLENLRWRSFSDKQTLLQRDCPVGNAGEEIDLMVDDAQGGRGIAQIAQHLL